LAKNLIAGGVHNCVLAVGFEKMERGSLGLKFPDRANPLQKFVERSMELVPSENMPKAFAPMLFGNAGFDHMKTYGTKP
jgi:sterol carrier protein 2